MFRISTSLGHASLVSLALAAAVFAAGCGSGHDPADHGADAAQPASGAQTQVVPAQKTCPVMGKPINPNIFVEYEGRKIYFCCQGCVQTFKADPAKYLAKLDAAAAPTGSTEEHGGSDHK